MYQVNFLPWRQRRDRRRGCFWLGALLSPVKTQPSNRRAGGGAGGARRKGVT